MSVLHFHITVSHKHFLCFSVRLEIWAWELNNADTSPCNKTRLWNKCPGFGVMPKHHVCHMEFIQKACSNVISMGQKHSVFSPLQFSNGQNLNGSKVKEPPEKTPVSDHPFVCLTLYRFRGTEKVWWPCCSWVPGNSPQSHNTTGNICKCSSRHSQIFPACRCTCGYLSFAKTNVRCLMSTSVMLKPQQQGLWNPKMCRHLFWYKQRTKLGIKRILCLFYHLFGATTNHVRKKV